MWFYSACFVKPLCRGFDNFTEHPAHVNKEANPTVRTPVAYTGVLE